MGFKIRTESFSLAVYQKLYAINRALHQFTISVPKIFIYLLIIKGRQNEGQPKCLRHGREHKFTT